MAKAKLVKKDTRTIRSAFIKLVEAKKQEILVEQKKMQETLDTVEYMSSDSPYAQGILDEATSKLENKISDLEDAIAACDTIIKVI